MLYEKKTAGETMDQFTRRIKQKYLVKKIAYTARLDPMAKGIVPFVINNECLKIKEYLCSNKTYEVKIIYGLQTDSDDPLGLITKINSISEDNILNFKELIINYLNTINNTSFYQKYHYYSTKMLNHRRQKSVDIKDKHLVALFSYSIKKEGIINYKKWKNKIINQINSIDVTKNFRQTEIIEQWNSLDITNLYYLKLNLSVSSGFFIRQLIRDMSESMSISLMAYSINRISID